MLELGGEGVVRVRVAGISGVVVGVQVTVVGATVVGCDAGKRRLREVRQRVGDGGG